MRDERNGIRILAEECPARLSNCLSSLGLGGMFGFYSASLRSEPVL